VNESKYPEVTGSPASFLVLWFLVLCFLMLCAALWPGAVRWWTGTRQRESTGMSRERAEGALP
jgi:hypothetical protein